MTTPIRLYRRGRAVPAGGRPRQASTGHRVRLQARLPDGTWGAFTAERVVTTEDDPEDTGGR
ncbi:hypothetical protein NFX46_24310 [Streptomyces phaeoluteigriseus]|uniref:Uncharacterized protein n=1 Tax=Streptomyces phaeoluteigriseus TaxID=114686 RepID=A0ABY4ZCX1_9ACTN|nr:hypothetical protein [Streptomyces phaeoluteigriseus]USQ86550.1 hypothetical protein NFX46_24310 [Streptomyces phaeoluteigriseus]